MTNPNCINLKGQYDNGSRLHQPFKDVNVLDYVNCYELCNVGQQQHAVVWDWPVIQKIPVQFSDGAVCCCCFLEQELHTHCSSQPSCIIGECKATLVVVCP